MPNTLRVFPLRARVGRGVVVMARVFLPTGIAIDTASLSAIKVKAKYRSGSATLDATLTVSAVVFNALQDGSAHVRWTKDDTGYNFAYEIPASAFTTTGAIRVEFLFTPTSGQAFSLLFEGPVESAFTF